MMISKGLFLFLSFLLVSCVTGEAVKTIPQDQGSIEVYFCPQEECEQELLSLLDSAQQSIHCALYDIGLKTVQEKLREKEKTIEVQVVTDSDYLKKFNHDFVKADTYGLM